MMLLKMSSPLRPSMLLGQRIHPTRINHWNKHTKQTNNQTKNNTPIKGKALK
jgi:hypothetical protein